MKITNLILASIKSARPIHWVKNLSLFAALILTDYLKQRAAFKQDFILVFWAFVAFSLAGSAIYIFNDIRDAKKDQLHPIKKNRPIASGALPKGLGAVISFALATASLYLASTLNTYNNLFFWAVVAYLLLQVVYSLGLKKLAIIDIIIIASGFVLRVYAGAFIINAHLSVWFLLTVISVALFLAAGKRRAELSVASPGQTRVSLMNYKKELLNSYVTMFGNAAWMSWALYTFYNSPTIDVNFLLRLADLSKATTISKLLMATIPVAIFIIMRYEAVIFADRSEAPEKVLLTDKALVGGIILWTGMLLYILYGGVAPNVLGLW